MINELLTWLCSLFQNKGGKENVKDFNVVGTWNPIKK